MSDDAADATGSTDDDSGRPTEMHEAVSAFLAGADDVYEEYDRGYVDADAALSVLSSRIDDLRAAAEDDDAGE